MDRDDQRQIIREKVAPTAKRRSWRRRSWPSRMSRRRSRTTSAGSLRSRGRTPSGGGVTYLNGRISIDRFPQYFFVAFGAKSHARLPRGDRGDLAGRPAPAGASCREELRLFLLPVVVLFLASIGTSYNIGIRHLLPVYPFLALAGSGPLRPGLGAPQAEPARRRRRPRSGSRCRWSRPRRSRASIRTSCPTSTRSRAAPSGAHDPLGLERGLGPGSRRLAAELAPPRRHRPTVVLLRRRRRRLPAWALPDFSASRSCGAGSWRSPPSSRRGPGVLRYHGARRSRRRSRSLQRRIARAGPPVGRVGYSIDLFELPQGDHP